uniref:Uncharacterized protein n=1 Tax=Timema monikensis TaxID=170555 RepID=A0A7R9EI87_9NEOP|nr:unnamed protein product [Timema monikensis]
MCWISGVLITVLWTCTRLASSEPELILLQQGDLLTSQQVNKVTYKLVNKVTYKLVNKVTYKLVNKVTYKLGNKMTYKLALTVVTFCYQHSVPTQSHSSLDAIHGPASYSSLSRGPGSFFSEFSGDLTHFFTAAGPSKQAFQPAGADFSQTQSADTHGLSGLRWGARVWTGPNRYPIFNNNFIGEYITFT